MERSVSTGEPQYTLGFRVRGVAKVVAWFCISLVSFVLLLKLIAIYPEPHIHQSSTNLFFNQGIYFTPDIAGLVAALFLIADFSMIFSILALILAGIGYIRIGQLDLYQDYAVLRKLKNKTEVPYDKFEDVYLGYMAAPSGPQSISGMYSPNSVPAFRQIASFYIGKKKFTFSINRKPGLAKFLEEKIPKKNFDVDDFAEEEVQGSDSSSQ